MNEKYNYYHNKQFARSMPPRFGKSVLNCSDEAVPGSHKRASRMNELMQEKILIGSENFTEQYGKILFEMHGLLKEEIMLFGDLTEQQANLWIDRNVDFNHVKQHEINGEKYLSIDPKIGDKYETG